jgi:hypothetical protein
MRDVKILRSWSLIGAVALGALLAGCGGNSDSSSGNASLRIANATLTHPSLALLANSADTGTATALDTISTYVSPASGATVFQVNDTGSGTALATITPTLTGDHHYTLLAYESGGQVQTQVLNEDFATPASGSAQVLVYDFGLDAGDLDVYITDPSTDLATVTSPTTNLNKLALSSGLLTFSPGTYRIRVTGSGNKSDLRLDIPSVTLANQQVASVALTPAAGGILLNGSTILQQSTYTGTRNTNSRVRLAAAVSGGASVAASAGSTVIDAGSVAPAFGFYVLVPASSALNITVNGQSVGAPATALTPGGDSTLFVYGNAGSATASLIADDNRPPTTTTNVKLRLLNGITGSAGALTLTANTSAVGTGIVPGAASAYVAVPGSTNAMNLSLTSSLSGGIFYSNTSNVLNAGTTYSVLAGGDTAAPQLLIR